MKFNNINEKLEDDWPYLSSPDLGTTGMNYINLKEQKKSKDLTIRRDLHTFCTLCSSDNPWARVITFGST